MLYALTAVCIKLTGRSIDNNISNDEYVQGYNPGPITATLSIDLSISISAFFFTLSGSVMTHSVPLSHSLSQPSLSCFCPPILHPIVHVPPSGLLCMACHLSPHTPFPFSP